MIKLNEKEKELFKKLKKSRFFRLIIFFLFFCAIVDIYRFILQPYVFSIYRTDLEIAQKYEPNHESLLFPDLKKGKRSGKQRVRGLHEISEICTKRTWQVEKIAEKESKIYYICNTKGRYIIDNFKNIYPMNDRYIIEKFTDIYVNEYNNKDLEFLDFIEDKIIVEFHIKNKKIIDIENKNITTWKEGFSTFNIPNDYYNYNYIHIFNEESYNPDYIGFERFRKNMKKFYTHYENLYKRRK